MCSGWCVIAWWAWVATGNAEDGPLEPSAEQAPLDSVESPPLPGSQAQPFEGPADSAPVLTGLSAVEAGLSTDIGITRARLFVHPTKLAHAVRAANTTSPNQQRYRLLDGFAGQLFVDSVGTWGGDLFLGFDGPRYRAVHMAREQAASCPGYLNADGQDEVNAGIDVGDNPEFEVLVPRLKHLLRQLIATCEGRTEDPVPVMCQPGRLKKARTYLSSSRHPSTVIDQLLPPGARPPTDLVELENQAVLLRLERDAISAASDRARDNFAMQQRICRQISRFNSSHAPAISVYGQVGVRFFPIVGAPEVTPKATEEEPKPTPRQGFEAVVKQWHVAATGRLNLSRNALLQVRGGISTNTASQVEGEDDRGRTAVYGIDAAWFFPLGPSSTDPKTFGLRSGIGVGVAWTQHSCLTEAGCMTKLNLPDAAWPDPIPVAQRTDVSAFVDLRPLSKLKINLGVTAKLFRTAGAVERVAGDGPHTITVMTPIISTGGLLGTPDAR